MKVRCYRYFRNIKNNPIKAIVKFNDGIAVVLKDDIVKKYTLYDDMIIGTDGLFYTVLHHYVDRFAKAFAGRHFTINLENGEKVECTGQWWDGFTEKSNEIIGGEIIGVTAQSIKQLKRCYVFSGHYAEKSKWAAFIKQYRGKIYGYWEYEKIVKNSKA